MDALSEIAKNVRLSKTLEPGEQIPARTFMPLVASGLVFAAATLVVGLGQS